MKICKNCIQPDTRPGIFFDENGVCGACLWHQEKNKINWSAREEELHKIAKWAKENTMSNYDCVIGVSGGKDSTFQALTARDSLGLRCLLVNYQPDNITKIGSQNIENLKQLGFDVISIRPNPQIMKKLVKFDFLGLKTLTILDQAVDRVNSKIKDKSKLIDIEDLPLNDSKTFELLQRAETTGVFQLESRGMRDYLRQLVPSDFEDIVSMNALYRPGALGMNMVDSYINRKHGREEVTYGHEAVEKILGTTYGVIVYQEQVMQIAQDLSGFSLGQADILRLSLIHI